MSFEQFRKDGFVEIDLERQTGTEKPIPDQQNESKDRKKPRMILFN